MSDGDRGPNIGLLGMDFHIARKTADNDRDRPDILLPDLALALHVDQRQGEGQRQQFHFQIIE